MNVLYGNEGERALRLLKDRHEPDEVAARLIISRSFSLWAAIKKDVEEILDAQREVQKQAMLQRTVWDVLKETSRKKRMEENRTYNEVHRDSQPSEIFLFNATDETFRGLVWDTKRIGGKAYTAAGVVIPHHRSVFIQKEEYERKKRDAL